MKLIQDRLFQTASVAYLSIISFLAIIPNERVWDDEKILGRSLAPESVDSPFQLWIEPYWGGDPKDTFRPLGVTVLYAERRFFGDSMLGFHCVSLLLHSLVALVLLRVFRKIAPEPVAWLATLLFAIHSAHAEAVAMGYGQLELLAALFALRAIDQYLVHTFTPNGLAAALVFAFLSACSKESGLMLPGVLVLLRGLYLKPDNPWTTRWFTWREMIFLVPGIVYLALRRVALGAVLPPPESTITFGYSATLRVKAVIVALGNAIRLSIFPTNQTLYYGHLRDHLANLPWSEMTWILAGAVLCSFLAKKIGCKAVLFAGGWFLITVFPVLNIVPCGVLFAERNLYFPLAALTFLIASIASRVVWNHTAISAVAIVLTSCVINSNLVVRQWRDNETLWRTTVADYPTSPMAHAALGAALLERTGREDDAEKCFERALELNPEVIGGKHGMALVAMRRGDYRRALAWLEKAQKSEPSTTLDNEISECKSHLSTSPSARDERK